MAARPTPIPSRMIAIIRSISARSCGPKSRTGEALLFSTGSPNLTTWASAASRRSRIGASSSARSPSSVPWRVVPRLIRARLYGSRQWPNSALLRIDVDADRDVAREPRSAARRSTASPTAATAACALVGLDQEAAAVAPADAEHRRRAEQVGVVREATRRGRPQPVGRRLLDPGLATRSAASTRTRWEKGG